MKFVTAARLSTTLIIMPIAIGHAIHRLVQLTRTPTLTLTEGTIPSESSVTGTVESSNHIRTGGTLMTIVCPFITLIHVCNSQ